MRILIFWFGLLFVFLFLSSSVIVAAEWTNYTKLPGNFANHSSLISEDGRYLFLVGGSVLKDFSRKSVVFTDLEDTNQIWQNASLMNRSVIWNSSIILNNYIYSIGGFDEIDNPTGNLSRNEVEYAKSNLDGSLSNWLMASNHLPYKGANGSSTVVGSRIYYSGGGVWGSSFNDLSIQSGIHYSAQVTQGDLSTWVQAGQLPARMLGHQLVYTGKKLYLIGGYNADLSTSTGQIFEAVLDSDGKINSWIGPLSNTFPDGNYKTYNFMQVIVGDILIVAGGRGSNLHDSRTSDKIFYSKIDTEGSLGPWKESPMRLPSPLCCAGIAASGNKIYITGGHDGAVYFDSVWSSDTGDILGISTTPTPTPVPPTPTTTPTTTERPYLVFVPGMLASWNSEALVHGKKVKNEEWKIPNSVDVYDEFLKTLYSVGYKKDKDLWVYNYDWRKNVLLNGAELKQYVLEEILKDKPADAKIALIGHSMGGLVARAAADSELISKISHLATFGTPHKGSVMSYPVWEGADFSDFSGLQSTLMRSYLRMNSVFFDSQVLAIHELVPSIQNLLPTWDFLKNKKGVTIKQNSLMWKNNVVTELELLLSHQSSVLHSFGGSGINTLTSYRVDKVRSNDYDYGSWTDGIPIQKEYSIEGDNTVLLDSALVEEGENRYIFNNSDHGEIVTKTASQNKLLELLDLSAFDRIENSKYKKFNRSIVVIVGSPVTFTVTDPDKNVFNPDDNLLLIDEPKSGEYKLDLVASEAGEYSVYFGRLDGSDEAWDERKGVVKTPGQTVSYNFEVDFLSSDLGSNPLKNFINRINLITNLIKPYNFRNNKMGPFVMQLKKLAALANQLEIQTLKPAQRVILSQMDREIGLLSKSIDKNYNFLSSGIRVSIIEQLRLCRLDIKQY
ncbi:MAG: hypothetical protein WCW29_04795, partial [Candidatus Paceibacterota bacterium]